MNHCIRRVLDCTKSNQLDYNVCIHFFYLVLILYFKCSSSSYINIFDLNIQLIMAEIEHCKAVQNNSSNNECDVLNNELLTLKCSITTCLYNLLYQKLESRTKINTEDSRLIFPNHCEYIS